MKITIDQLPTGRQTVITVMIPPVVEEFLQALTALFRASVTQNKRP
jgi:hypothetical protein